MITETQMVIAFTNADLDVSQLLSDGKGDKATALAVFHALREGIRDYDSELAEQLNPTRTEGFTP